MIFLIHSAMDAGSIDRRLGDSDYSYFFVLDAFRPALETQGVVIPISDPTRDADRIWRNATAHGEDCVLMSFAPPQRMPLGLECPTILVFAWEFDTIPYENWFGEPQQDWRYGLDRCGRAITHSSHMAKVVQDAMGADYPVASIAAPVWDRFSALGRSGPPRLQPRTIPVTGAVIDSRDFDFTSFEAFQRPPAPTPTDRMAQSDLHLDGVVYLSVLNPYDGRKNWTDMVGGFCWALRDAADATLVLKLGHPDCVRAIASIWNHMRKIAPLKCRVVIIDGYLEPAAYDALLGAATYVANSSHGEGQCLPLMEGMAAGKPAVAPDHTGMGDYVNADTSFVVRSCGDPSAWPHDPRQGYRVLRRRIDFESLVEAYRDSYRIAHEAPAAYARMSVAASEALRGHASQAVAAERMAAFLKSPARPADATRGYGRILPRFDAPWIVEAS